MQKEALEAQQRKSLTSHAPVNYRGVDAIFRTYSLEGTTSKERSIYINEAHRASYSTVLTGPPNLEQANMFSKVVACAVHFLHNDALIVAIHIGNRRVSRILVDSGGSVNILYVDALDRMEDTLEMARTMINPQTRSNLYGFDGMRLDLPARSRSRSVPI